MTAAPASTRPRVVIVGAGFGGLAAARRLAGEPVDMVLIDRTNHHLFQPLLYQVATAVLSPSEIATAVRPRLRSQRNITMLMAEVTGIDTEARRVRLGHGPDQPYDWLVLATGADYSFFGHSEWAEHAHVLKTIEDARAIRQKLLLAFEEAELEGGRSPPTVAIVGGGPTGVEMAGAVAEMAKTTLAGDFRRIDPKCTRVLLLEAGPRLLSAFPATLSDYARTALQRLGVEVRTSAAVQAVTSDGVQVNDEMLETTAVIWCAGVRARPAADWLGVAVARGGAAAVTRDCSVPGHSNIFVIGDAAFHETDQGALPGLAPVAKQQGVFVGGQIASRIGGRLPRERSFRYRDWGSMAVIGRSRAVAVFGRIRLKGFVAWLAWSLVHLMLLIDFRSRVVVYVNWTWAWFTYGRGARLISRS